MINRVGTTLQGRYRIEQLVGQGGMGSVYLARQVRLADRPVAIKELVVTAPLPEEQEQYSRQFQREARILAGLHHPGLVDVKDFFEEQGAMFLVMDYVEGSNLAQLTQGPAKAARILEVLGWAQQLVEVFCYLHQHDPPIVVRDLKPANVMLQSGGRIRLIDFGIAREHKGGLNLTTSLQGVGSPGYAPPEQYAGKTDHRSDIYALGATTYALISGQQPTNAMTRAGGVERLPRLDEVNPKVCETLARCVADMMALRASERPKDMAAVGVRVAEAVEAQEAFYPPDLDQPVPVGPLDSAPPTALLDPTTLSQAPTVPQDYTAKVTMQFDDLPTEEPPPARWLSPGAVATVVGIVLGMLVLVNSAHHIDPPPPPRATPLPGTESSATPQVTKQDTPFTDPAGMFSVTVPARWRYAESDSTLPGTLPPFCRVAMSSLLKRKYAAVECFDGCPTVSDAVTVVRTFLTSEGQSPQIAQSQETSPAGTVYTVELMVSGEPVSGRLYLRPVGSRVCCLSLWCSGATFDTSDDALNGILSSYH